MDTGGGNSLQSSSCPDGSKRRVCYYYDAGIANVDYGEEHSMVPRRVDMAHALVRSYGLLGDMKRLRTRPATDKEICAVHDKDYVRLLQDLIPEAFNAGGSIMDRAQGFMVGVLSEDGHSIDNPAISGLWDYCQRYAGGSLAAARALGSGEVEIAINWSGGMHHACKAKASGFCYVNDIALAITELLNQFRRVLYVDIDVHHGDGVETEFVEDYRVMTVSFHQRTEGFFPQETGFVTDVGKGKGLYHALNVPMREGMDDEGYYRMFKPIMDKVMQVFQPEAIVMQCGADSLSGDRLGQLNLSIAGHAKCVSFMRSFNKPLLLLGGGGYTINHVAACWCYETAVAIGKEIDDDIPPHCYDHYYGSQGYKLHYPVRKARKNENTECYMSKTTNKVLEHLSKLEAAPSVEFKDPIGRSIDAKALFHDSPPGEEDDPMERLQRRCGERDERHFLVELGKRQLILGKDKENGGSQLYRSEPVKKYRSEKFRFKL
ncbi:histone deacetylase 1-like [Phragmites australis]|uniref:histone deacetylase 1-like n=1 Tax=Phragmites australis TaxID=29695 RepID=UPI002D794F64|nr:histone deacetylase 1-like [Phragmites australis]